MINKLNEDTALKFKTLNAEDKKRKGTLGRLYGPIASCAEATRNGRKYSEALWENLFNSDLIKERFANGGIFGQLCHPEYEDVDMEKIACVMPEPPVKDDNGQLIAYVDILDTPCGRIAYQLAKYGYKFGISSRGSGDLIDGPDGEEVDPDTYNLTAFDLVEIPAVANARLSFVESLDTKKYNKTLRQSLQESLDRASEGDKKVMAEALDNLGIKLTEGEKCNDESCIGEDMESLQEANYGTVEEYKGYNIDHNVYGQNEYSVQVDGDDVMFETIDEAKAFIDSLDEGNMRDVSAEEVEESLQEDLIQQPEIKGQNTDLKKKQKEQDDVIRDDKVGSFSDGISIGTELSTKTGNRIKIRDISVKYIEGKPQVFFSYDFITKAGKKGSGSNFAPELYDLLLESVDTNTCCNESEKESTGKTFIKDVRTPDGNIAKIYCDDSGNHSIFTAEGKWVDDGYISVKQAEEAIKKGIVEKDPYGDKHIVESNNDNNITPEEAEKILAIFEKEHNFWDNAPEVLNDRFNNGDYIVEVDNSNPTYISSLEQELIKLEQRYDIGYDSKSNSNGFYGRTYTFYHYNDIDESNKHASKAATIKEGQEETTTPNQARARANAYLKNHPEATKDELAKKQGYESFDGIDDDEVAMGIEAALKDHGLEEECNSENCSDKEEEKEVDNVKSKNEAVAELQEALQRAKKLDKDNLSLQEKLSVCTAKETKLEEEVKRYKQAVASLSDTAKKAKSYKKDVDRLTEDLNKKDNELKSNNTKVVELTESVNKAKDLQTKIKDLTNQLDETSKQLESSNDLVNKYRNSYKALKESYLAVKAKSYGLTKEDVLSKLNESYKIRDIDSVCESLAQQKRNMSKLPFRITEDTRITAKKSPNEHISNEFGSSDDEVSDSLLHLANLK